MTQDTLAGGEGEVGGDKAAGGGVVVAGLEVIELGLGIVGIATVAEGLVGTESDGKGASGGEELAPAVVGVLDYGCAGGVNEFDYIPLSVADIVVLRAVVSDGDGVASGIVMELLSTATQPLVG